MATDYGQLGEVVAVSGSLMAASTAIGLAWTQRTKWMPPEESVTDGTLRLSGLISAVTIGILYLLRSAIGLENMTIISAICLIVALVSLAFSIYTNTTYSFIRRQPGRKIGEWKETRILGGSKLTTEATAIAKRRHMEPQALFENSNYKPDLVWTQKSRAHVQMRSTIGFIFLQSSGSLALASISIAFGLNAIQQA